MEKYFLPYYHNLPAAIEIKGHRLLIVTCNEEDMLDELSALGGDEIREIQVGDFELEPSNALATIAAENNCGVVLTPPGISPSLMISSLERQLPWVN